MKLRPITLGRWAELAFGVFIPGVYILPFLMQTSWFVISLPFTFPNVSADFSNSALVIAVTIVTFTALLLLSALVLVGAERVNRREVLRVSMITMGCLGLVIGALFFLSGLEVWINLFAKREFWGLFSKKPFFNLSTWEFIFFEDTRFISLVLIGPLIIGFKYLRALLKGINVKRGVA